MGSCLLEICFVKSPIRLRSFNAIRGKQDFSASHPGAKQPVEPPPLIRTDACFETPHRQERISLFNLLIL